MIKIDHIFIFVNSKRDADILVDLGLNEGSGNIHKGIGTANRRFFLNRFYLEILWVDNKTETTNIKDVELFKRYDFKNSGFSRFGICLENTKDSNKIFQNSLKWEAPFLAKNSFIDILTNEKMPWIFRLPSNRSANTLEEPRKHKLGVFELTKVIFYQKELSFQDKLQFLQNNSMIEFCKASKNTLVLEFDNYKQRKSITIEEFDLVIRY